jgi:uncharacterized protein YkwD
MAIPPKGGLTVSEPVATLVFVPRKNHIYVVFAVVFLVFAAAPAALAAHRSSAELSFLATVNSTRASFGLQPLHLDATLERAARSHSADMLRHSYFAHGNFHSRMLAFHVQGPTAGENLAWGTGSFGQAAVIVKEWLASPEHRANLLRPGYSRIGLGILRGSFLGNGGATVVTADFAGR